MVHQSRAPCESEHSLFVGRLLGKKKGRKRVDLFRIRKKEVCIVVVVVVALESRGISRSKENSPFQTQKAGP